MAKKRPQRRPKSSRSISNPHGLYSYSDVCELTTLSRQTIYRLRRKGLFPKCRKLTTGRVVWSKPVIHHYLAGTWKPTPADPDGGDDDDGNAG